MKKYLLFDLDGTLTKSGDGIINAALYALEHGRDAIGRQDFDHAYEIVTERYRNRGSENGFKVVSSERITEEEYLNEIKGEG